MATMKTATVPMVPASVGEKIPFMRPPIITKKTIPTVRNSGRAFPLSFHDDRSPPGAMVGSILTHPKITTANRKEIRSPGSTPARKSFPMDCCVMMPKMISVMLGGMRIPKVPTEATMPFESFLL